MIMISKTYEGQTFSLTHTLTHTYNSALSNRYGLVATAVTSAFGTLTTAHTHTHTHNLSLSLLSFSLPLSFGRGHGDISKIC